MLASFRQVEDDLSLLDDLGVATNQQQEAATAADTSVVQPREPRGGPAQHTPQFLQRKQVLEAQLRAAEESRQREKRISEYEASVQQLHSAGDLQGSLARVQQGLAEFPDEARLLRMKSVVEKSIGEAEELKRREQERKRSGDDRAHGSSLA